MKPILYTTPHGIKHDTGAGHPECASRLEVLHALFSESPFCEWVQKEATEVAFEDILLAHSEEYVFKLQDAVPEAGLVAVDGDTILSPQSYQAAIEAAGAVCQAVKDLKSGESDRVFCAVRPPGHHAEPDFAMGFCLFNNIFIGARAAQEKYCYKNIVIVDFDVHHGNGTDTMVRRHNRRYHDRPITYISTHGYPLFPMTGNPADNGEYVTNIYLPRGCSSEEMREIYEGQVFPAVRAATPDLLMISAGFDAHRDDPLADSCWESEDYGWLTRGLCQAAGRVPVVSVLEGGYNLEALKSAVLAHLLELGA